MSISDADMDHLKALARLELSPEETRDVKQDLNKILASFEQIRNLDTEGSAELVRPVLTHNVFRQDEVRGGLDPERVQQLAIETEDNFFKVPRTVDSGE